MSTTERQTRTGRPAPDAVELEGRRESRAAHFTAYIGDLISRGAIAGFSAGIAFILIEMA